MPHYGDGRATEESIRTATRNALEKAEALDCASLVVPVLGTGAAGFDFETGAKLVCSEIAAFEAHTLEDVKVIAYGDAEYRSLEDIASSQ
jgi:O-acetyl-ADP-ribose deacetylase (regulator of RNase III)